MKQTKGDGYVKIPHWYLRTINKGVLTYRQIRCLNVIVGKTWAWHKSVAEIKPKIFMKETGMDVENIRKALNQLFKIGILIRNGHVWEINCSALKAVLNQENPVESTGINPVESTDISNQNPVDSTDIGPVESTDKNADIALSAEGSERNFLNKKILKDRPENPVNRYSENPDSKGSWPQWAGSSRAALGPDPKTLYGGYKAETGRAEVPIPRPIPAWTPELVHSAKSMGLKGLHHLMSLGKTPTPTVQISLVDQGFSGDMTRGTGT